jgi:hypothetical protein
MVCLSSHFGSRQSIPSCRASFGESTGQSSKWPVRSTTSNLNIRLPLTAHSKCDCRGAGKMPITNLEEKYFVLAILHQRMWSCCGLSTPVVGRILWQPSSSRRLAGVFTSETAALPCTSDCPRRSISIVSFDRRAAGLGGSPRSLCTFDLVCVTAVELVFELAFRCHSKIESGTHRQIEAGWRCCCWPSLTRRHIVAGFGRADSLVERWRPAAEEGGIAHGGNGPRVRRDNQAAGAETS